MTSTGRGRVVTRAGWPVPGVRVTLIGAAGAQAGLGVSDADGLVTLTDLTPGHATMLVTAPGYDPQVTVVRIPEGEWQIGTLHVERSGGDQLPEPGTWDIDPTHSSVSARARHLGLATVRGRFAEFGGVIHVAEEFESSRVEVAIEAASIQTGNGQRDDHLRSGDFLDVAHHPQITYVGERLTRDGRGFLVAGQLTMAGTTRPVDLAMTYQGSAPDPWGGTRAGFTATATLRREDFAMNWNQAVALGLDMLGTTLAVDIEIEAVRRA